MGFTQCKHDIGKHTQAFSVMTAPTRLNTLKFSVGVSEVVKPAYPFLYLKNKLKQKNLKVESIVA